MGWWASSSKLDIYIFVSLKFPALILIPLKIYILTLYQNQLSRLNSLNYVHSSRNCITITPWEATICASSKFIISPYHLRFLIPILPLLLERRCRDDNTIISKRTFYSVKKKKKRKKNVNLLSHCENVTKQLSYYLSLIIYPLFLKNNINVWFN